MVVTYLDFPSVCEIRDKMQVVYKEFTGDWVESKVAENEFYLKIKTKRERIEWKIHHS